MTGRRDGKTYFMGEVLFILPEDVKFVTGGHYVLPSQSVPKNENPSSGRTDSRVFPEDGFYGRASWMRPKTPVSCRCGSHQKGRAPSCCRRPSSPFGQTRSYQLRHVFLLTPPPLSLRSLTCLSSLPPMRTSSYRLRLLCHLQTPERLLPRPRCSPRAHHTASSR